MNAVTLLSLLYIYAVQILGRRILDHVHSTGAIKGMNQQYNCRNRDFIYKKKVNMHFRIPQCSDFF